MSFILAKILGIYFLAIGIAFLINPDRFRRMCAQVRQDENFLLLGGILALLIGAVIVSLHNYWVLGWPVIITILGWWSLIKGFTLLVYPESIKLFSSLQNKSNTFFRIISGIYLLIGIFLLYKGIR